MGVSSIKTEPEWPYVHTTSKTSRPTEPKKEMPPSNQITLQIHLFVDEQGKITATSEGEGAKVVIDRAAVKASSHTCVKKSEGQILAKRIKDAMELRGMSNEALAKKAGIGKTTLYAYLKSPGNAPLSKLLAICRAVGIRQINLDTGGTYL